MAVSGIGLAAVATGSLLVYAGAKGYSIPTALTDMIRGQAPSTGQTPPTLTLATGNNQSGPNLGGIPTPGKNGQFGSHSQLGSNSGAGTQVPANLKKLLLGGKHKTTKQQPLVFPLVCPAGYEPDATNSTCIPVRHKYG